MFDQDAYQHKNVRLTPTIIAEIAAGLFEGQIVNRNEMLAKIQKFHIDRGGLDSQAKSIDAALKKALVRLRKTNLATRIGYGQYEFPSKKGDDAETLVPVADDTKSELAESDDKRIKALSTVGSGAEIVYAYSYPTYRELANSNGEISWAMKVGMSRSGLTRVTDQVGTSLPEYPEIRIAIHTDNAAELEKLLHNFLSYAGRRLEGAPGSEWFRTNEQEIKSILDFIEKLRAG